jgi:hypothetical protein
MSPLGSVSHHSEGDDESGEGEFSVAGSPVQCPHCSGCRFKIGRAQLNTALATLLNLDWIDRSANVLICTTCSQIQWFGDQPERIF